MFLLDTNVCVMLLNRSNEALWRQVHATDPRELFISVITSYELWFGAFKSARQVENVARVDALLFQVLSLDKEDARVAGEVRAALENQGRPIGPHDHLIAGQAMARELTLVTNNSREFGRIKGLKVVDWS